MPATGFAAGAAAGTPTAMTPPPSSSAAEQYLLTAANRARAARGLSPLHYDATLAQAAKYHALQMAEHRDISHQFQGEPDLMQRGAQAGVKFSLITENVADSPDSSILHDLWMRSPGHRENLLDPEVNSIGIAIVSRGGRYYAVEDFASTVESLSFDEQEQTVAMTLAQAGLRVGSSNITSTTDEARRTCGLDSGFAGSQNKPMYIVRYTADHLDQLPGVLTKRIESGKFHKAVVGACTDAGSGAFTDYNIAVLLYP
ncbi:MAG: CAP domain-containing protein [Edaphobacter sp.]|uniref:CAP domain-containing protein n=1 Tax=Edaphobacter sp. TaxID=1934404 RepID=UPI0023886065|nr:CAP domain-containing protein [Edaphobacter sp.]MDE1175089.1 CAP domain-containing protein [Edaphobacter sp.]